MKILFKITILTALFLGSCSHGPKTDHSAQGDDAFCSAIGLSQDPENPIIAEVYWRCRSALTEKKLIDYLKITKNKNRNPRYLKELRLQFGLAYENLNNYRNEFLNKRHHKLCQKRGLDANSLDQEEVERYLVCRQKLIKIYQINPPYKKTLYLKRPQDSYQIGFVINKHQDERAASIVEAEERYGDCAYLDVDSDKFKQCRRDFEKRKSCTKEARLLKAKKHDEERRSCQNKMYSYFPQSLIREDELRLKAIKRREEASDFHNKNNFTSIGISPDMLKKFGPKKVILKKKSEKKTSKKNDEKPDFNNEKGLYTRPELTRLRQKFVKRCNSAIKYKIEEYFVDLNQKCQLITSFWQDNRGKNEQ